MPTKHTKPQPNLKIKQQGYYKHNAVHSGFKKENKNELIVALIMRGHDKVLKENVEDLINKDNILHTFAVSHQIVYTDGSYYTD